MAFALTKYIYPLEKHILLSEQLNYILDNPRSDEEIDIIAKYISQTLDAYNSESNPTSLSLEQRAGIAISEIHSFLRNEKPDSYECSYLNNSEEKNTDIKRLLAQMWVIIRFESEENFHKLAVSSSYLITAVFEKNKRRYAQEYADLASYCHLISLLCNDDIHYYGESFLLTNNAYELFFSSPHEHVNNSVESLNNYAVNLREFGIHLLGDWLSWPTASERVLNHAKRVDSLIAQDAVRDNSQKNRLSQKQTPKQKLTHTGNLLKISFEHLQEPEILLLLQVSIIEYLLTRNPDSNRFNVEDSINKQFRLKCTIIVHQSDKSTTMTEIGERLSKIYSQRSDLAHGNYRDHYNKDEVIESGFFLLKVNKHIINRFIDDREFIEYLKDN